MKKLNFFLLTLLIAVLFASQASASSMLLMRKEINELETLSGASVDPAADYIPMYDASALKVKKVLANGVGLLPGLTSSATELNYLDITTLGLAQASKALTFDTNLDAIIPSLGLITIQSGGGITVDTGGVITVEGVVVNKKQLSLPGRVDITICGDGTTINNNTVYYGPSMVPVANGVRTCDTTQAGNVTEATADTPALDNTAFQVLSMDCLTADPGAAGVTFALRSAAAATTPSVTCSVANTKLGCTANVQTTTAIAAGATLAIAATSTGNQGTTPFACTIHAAY